MVVFILLKMKILRVCIERQQNKWLGLEKLTKKVESGFITQQLRENENEGVAELWPK